jgi:hypothetical protein
VFVYFISAMVDRNGRCVCARAMRQSLPTPLSRAAYSSDYTHAACYTASASHLAALRYRYQQARAVLGSRGDVLNLAQHRHGVGVNHLAKDDVLAVEPLCFCQREEELAAVGVGPGVGRRQQPRVRQGVAAAAAAAAQRL